MFNLRLCLRINLVSGGWFIKVNAKMIYERFMLVILIIMLGSGFYHEVFKASNIQRPELNKPITEVEKELRVELNKIGPLPGATAVGTSDRHNDDLLALVQNRYNSTLTMTEIYQHYNEQFVKNGWQFYKEKSISIWGKDYGDREFIYKKGDYEAVLDYTAPNPTPYQTFVVSTSWGIID